MSVTPNNLVKASEIQNTVPHDKISKVSQYTNRKTIEFITDSW